MRDFLVALQFLTRLTLYPKLEMTQAELARSVRVYPFVGLLIGSLLAGLFYCLAVLVQLPPLTVVILVLVSEIVLTGGLHLDGFMDAADGLLRYRPKEKILEIMKDSRVGANAVLALICLLLTKMAFLSSIPPNQLWIVVLMPTLSRWSLVYLAMYYPHASPKGSLGAMVIGQTSPAGFRISTGLCGLLVLIIAWASWQLSAGPLLSVLLAGLVMWFAVLLTSRAVARAAMRKIGGITGDVLGAALELAEVVALLLGIASLRLLG